MKDFESPFHRWPIVTAINDENGTGVHISGTFQTIAAAFYISACYPIVVFLPTLIAVITALEYPRYGRLPVVWLVAVIPAYYFAWRPLMRRIFGSVVDVRVYPGVIKLRDTWAEPYRNYSRDLPIEIRIEENQKIHGKGPRQLLKLYEKSVEVVMHYGLKRVVLAEFERTNLEDAQSLVLRLQEAVIKIAVASATGKQLQSVGRASNDIEISDIR